MLPIIKDDFKKKISSMENYIALIVSDAKNYQDATTDLLNYLVSIEKIPGIYITLNKPYDIILRELNNRNIDPRLILFIDCITKISPGGKTKIQNCLFIKSPERLSDLFVALEQAISAIPLQNKFIFLDSLNTLKMFNTESTVARFVYQLVSKMRSWKIKGVIITIEKESDKTLINELTPFCDIRLEVN